jgi:hypothetical protein
LVVVVEEAQQEPYVKEDQLQELRLTERQAIPLREEFFSFVHPCFIHSNKVETVYYYSNQ